jgi:hypothetical protein
MSYYMTHEPRPHRQDADKESEVYHLENARWAIGEGMGEEYQDFHERAERNKRFYRGEQWDDEEDYETFLQDETGEERNRLQICQNVIRPIVEQYRGNVSRMSLNAKVRSASPNAISRREDKLQEKLLLNDVADEMAPALENIIKEQYDIGDTKQETKEKFDNLWIDEYELAMERLTEFIRKNNSLDDILYACGEELALTGLCVMYGYNHGGHRRYKMVESEKYLWDPSARRDDHSDASFWGLWDKIDVSTIYEFYNLDKLAIDILERHAQNSVDSDTGHYDFTSTINDTAGSGRPTVYYIYWRDFERYDFGYVEDDYGFSALVRIGEDTDMMGNVYTEQDVIDPPNTEEDNRIFGDKRIVSRVVDVIRYAHVILNEELISGETNRAWKERISEYGDLVLDYGLFDYPEPNIYDDTEVLPPIKVRCWSFINGYINSPIDDIIDPQRMINRVLSVAESQINSSGGVGVVYDKDAVGPDGEEEVVRALNKGGPVPMYTRGMGVQNVMYPYDNTVKQGTMGLFSLVNQYKSFIQDTTGVNSPMQGQGTGEDQLVGVTQMLIEQGSLIQEPFYYAMSQLMLQAFQDMITVGKDYYIDNNNELAMAVGDRSARVIRLTEDMKHEYFAAFVEREAADEMLQQSANKLIQFLMENQMVGQSFFAEHYNNSTPDQVMRALRQKTGEQAEANKEAQKKQKAAMLKAQQEAQQEEEVNRMREEAKEAKENEKKRQQEIEKEMTSQLGEMIQSEGGEENA